VPAVAQAVRESAHRFGVHVVPGRLIISDCGFGRKQRKELTSN